MLYLKMCIVMMYKLNDVPFFAVASCGFLLTSKNFFYKCGMDKLGWHTHTNSDIHCIQIF